MRDNPLLGQTPEPPRLWAVLIWEIERGGAK